MKRKDIYLLAGLITAGLLIGLIVFFSGKSGNMVSVRVDGREVMTFSLEEDQEYEIQGEGGRYNKIIIRNGEVWMEEASCPDHLCMKMGHLSKSGQSIICLPNKVVIEIRGQENEVDEIAK